MDRFQPQNHMSAMSPSPSPSPFQPQQPQQRLPDWNQQLKDINVTLNFDQVLQMNNASHCAGQEQVIKREHVGHSRSHLTTHPHSPIHPGYEDETTAQDLRDRL